VLKKSRKCHRNGIVHRHWRTCIHHPKHHYFSVQNFKKIWSSNFQFLIFKGWLRFRLPPWTWTTVGAANTPQRANKKPYRHGTDAPRHYPHTLIVVISNWAAPRNPKHPLSTCHIGIALIDPVLFTIYKSSNTTTTLHLLLLFLACKNCASDC
jgi:hypothetical protein